MEFTVNTLLVNTRINKDTYTKSIENGEKTEDGFKTLGKELNSIPGYITESILIPQEKSVKVKQIKILNKESKRSTILFTYPGSEEEHVLYNADVYCEHEIQAQFSGIKCIKCGGWYCA